MYDEDDSVEMSLLDEDDRRQASAGIDRPEEEHVSDLKKPMSTKDKRAMVLLCVLCECKLLLSGLSLIVQRFNPRSAGRTYARSVFLFYSQGCIHVSWDWL